MRAGRRESAAVIPAASLTPFLCPLSSFFLSLCQILDRYFGNVCELDIIFNFHKAYYLLDETMIAGELQETSKQKVLHATVAQDMLIKAANGQDS